MFSQNDVMDEADFASLLEEKERSAGIQSITKNIPRNIDIDSMLDEDLRCIVCDSVIPIERQKIVFSLTASCNYCVLCQKDIDKTNRLYA